MLSDIPILSLALALVIAWALFAIFCSLLHEAIAQIKAERGRFMKQYLLKQLQDVPNGVNWASLLYLHGTIDLLSRAPGKPTNDIAPKLFAQALIDTVANTQLVKMQSLEEGAAYADKVLNNFSMATKVLKQSDVVSLFKQSLMSAELDANANGVATDGKIYVNLVFNLEKWYTEFTERLTLWYKKKTRQRLFILGCLLGFILNVDSIELFKNFDQYPANKNTLINFYQKNETSLDRLANGDSTQPADTSFFLYKRQMDSLSRAMQLPVGFSHSFLRHPQQPAKLWVLKILGIWITGFAASFGAPFWFDILKKATLKKPL